MERASLGLPMPTSPNTMHPELTIAVHIYIYTYTCTYGGITTKPRPGSLSSPLIGFRTGVRRVAHAESTIQNTKLQKYTRGAVTTGRAVLASIAYSIYNMNSVYGYRVQRREIDREKESVYTWHGTVVEQDDPRLC